MIHLRSKEEIELLRESNLLVASTHAELVSHIKPGVTTKKLDEIAEEFIRDNKGIPAFKGLYGFPSSLCISQNEQVVHGFPSDYVIQEGDIISIDCGVELNGYFGDSAFTYPIGDIGAETRKLLNDTIIALYLGIGKAQVNNRIGDIASAIQNYTEAQGYGVVRELVGHGVGKKLHEKPEVPNYGRAGHGKKLKAGLVIAIEPMINLGTRKIVQHSDGWTITTQDEKPSAHFEHTIAVTDNGPDVLSDFERIHEAIKNNAYIVDFDEKIRYLQTNLKNG